MYCKFCKEIFDSVDKNKHNRECTDPNNYHSMRYKIKGGYVKSNDDEIRKKLDEIERSIPELNFTTQFERYRQNNSPKSNRKLQTYKDFDSKSEDSYSSNGLTISRSPKSYHTYSYSSTRSTRSRSPKSNREIKTHEDFDSSGRPKKRHRSHSPASDSEIKTREDSEPSRYTKLEQHLLEQIKKLEDELEQIKYKFIYAKFEYDAALQKQEAKIADSSPQLHTN